MKQRLRARLKAALVKEFRERTLRTKMLFNWVKFVN